MIPSVEEGKNAFLKVYTAEIKRDHPSWTFARCWQAAQAEHPDLAESFEAPAAASQGYRYQPSPRRSARRSEELSEEIRRLMDAKVEADKKDDSGELMLVMASDGSVDHLELG